MNLSIVYITCRDEPRLDWVCDFTRGWDCEVLVVATPNVKFPEERWIFRVVEPKPTVWSGPHRLTKTDWWSASNARNTGLCYAKRDYVLFLDDRSWLGPNSLSAIKEAMTGNYCACGTYIKVHNMEIKAGVPHYSKIDGVDNRISHTQSLGPRPPYKCPGQWTYTCALIVPLLWALDIGGFDETCDGLGMEDCIFGLMLQNAGRPIYFDPRIIQYQDRTHGQAPVTKKDKGVSPNDKSHALLNKLKGLNHTLLPTPDIRVLRAMAQTEKPFPAPLGPTVDWYDAQPISEMT